MKRFLYVFVIFSVLFANTYTVYAGEERTETGSEADENIESDENVEADENVESDEDSESGSLKEITTIFNEKLLAQNEMLECGDTKTLEAIKEGWKWVFSYVGGATADLQHQAALEMESIDYGGIDVKKPGIYTVTVVLKLQDSYAKEFIVSDRVRTLHIKVIVSEPGKITFSYNRSYENFAQYDFRAPKGVEPILWFAKVPRGAEPEDKDWEEAEVDTFYLSMPGAVRVLGSALSPGSDYYLQMRGGGLVSDVLKLDTSLMLDSNEGINGDRDGDDNNDHTTEPPLMQPSPSPGGDKGGSSGNLGSKKPVLQKPVDKDDDKTGKEDKDDKGDKDNNSSQTKPSDESEKGDYEQVTDDTITISGERLKWLLDSYGDKVPFGWNKVSVEIPAKVFKKMKLSSKDKLSMTMTRKDNKSASISLSANGGEIEDIEGAVMRIPAPDGTYTLSKDGELLDTPVSCENGLAEFSIDQTGSYELMEKEEALAAAGEVNAPLTGGLSKEKASVLPEPGFKDFLPVAAGCVGLSGLVGWYLWRRRRW